MTTRKKRVKAVRYIGYKRLRYMIATTAIHKLGDISRRDGDLCTVHARAGDNFIGAWVTGFGFIEVKFPVDTTRRLTEEEKKHWNGRTIGVGSWSYKISISSRHALKRAGITIQPARRRVK